MQRPTMRPRGPSTTVTNLAKTILLPHDKPPCRLPTFPNLERTAVCNFETNVSTNSSNYGSATRRAALLREPAAPFWLDRKVANSSAGRATGAYMWSGTTTATFLDAQEPAIIATGDLAVIGNDGDSDWAFLPLDQTNNLQAYRFDYTTDDPAVPTINVSYTLLYQDGTKRVFNDQLSHAAGGTIFINTLYSNCWFRLDAVRIPGHVGTWQLVAYPLQETRILAPAYPPPQTETSTAPYCSSRVTALSLLSSNVSRVQIKQGTITAARFSAVTPAFWSFTETEFQNVHPADRYYGPSENGLYVVAPPTQESEVLRDHVRLTARIVSVDTNNHVTEGTLWAPMVNPDSDSPFMAVIYQEEQSVDETLFAFTTDIHLEFRTSSPLFQVGISTVPLEQYHAAQLVVAQTGYFYENPTHWTELALKIASIAARVVPVLLPGTRIATVARAAQLLLPRQAASRNMTQKQMVRPPTQRRARPRPQRQRQKPRQPRNRRS